MAFKALNWNIIHELDLKMVEVHNCSKTQNCFHAAMFVFGFQLLMIVFIYSIILSEDFHIVLPANVSVLGARFLCTILMHLQVEGDLR